MRLVEATKFWIKHLESENCKQTVKTYKNRFIQFVEYFQKEEIEEIDKFALKEFFHHLRQNTNLKTSSIHLTYNTLRNFFNFLVENDVLENNPIKNIKKLKYRSGEVKASEIDKSMNLQTLSEIFQAFEKDLRMNVLLSLLYTTGARIHEILAIKVSNIRGNEILLEKTKTGQPKYIFIDQTVNRLLWKYIKTLPHCSDYLFPSRWQERGGHMTYHAFRAQLKKYFPNINFHAFRETWFSERVEEVPAFALRDLSDTTIQTINHYAKKNKQRALRTFMKTRDLSQLDRIMNNTRFARMY